MTKKTQIINVQNIAISVITTANDDFISITDIAKAKGGDSRKRAIVLQY